MEAVPNLDKWEPFLPIIQRFQAWYHHIMRYSGVDDETDDHIVSRREFFNKLGVSCMVAMTTHQAMSVK